PDQLRLVPIYLMLVNWIPGWVGHIGWHNASFINRQGVILIQLVSAASLFLMRQYFLTIPRDLEEAAKLDGAGYFKTYRKVMLPLLAGPAIAALMHCAVTLAQTEELRLGEALTGLRRHWRRGLVLGMLLAVAVGVGALAGPFYAHVGTWAWPLAAVCVYLLLM